MVFHANVSPPHSRVPSRVNLAVTLSQKLGISVPVSLNKISSSDFMKRPPNVLILLFLFCIDLSTLSSLKTWIWPYWLL